MGETVFVNGLGVTWQVEGVAAQPEAEVRGLGDGFGELLLRLKPGRVERIRITVAVAEGALSADSARVLALGESRVAGRGVVALSELPQGDGAACVDAIAVVLAGGERALLVGIGGFTPDFPRIAVGSGSVEVSFAPERELEAPLELSLVVGESADAHALLEAYGDILARGGRRVGEIPTGWNSWDYYQAAMTMEDLRQELQAIRKSPLNGRLKYFCLDMGWEEAWGDWRPNRSFPELKQIAQEIRAAGMEPGIWLSPLQMRTTLPVARHNREMFCRDRNGQLVITGGQLLLDPTHPWTREWLSGLGRGLREAGFTLFKIDYLYRDYLNMMDQMHAPVGKAAAARLFLEIIREAIGDDAHLLACGAGLPAGLGLADSARISTDIHNFWGHVRNSAMQLAMNYWLSGRVWVNDPDFALIRCAETTDAPYLNVPYTSRPYVSPEDFWMAGEEATLAELKTWLALVHLCGGSLFAADSIARLNALGLGMLEKLLAEPTSPARPVDLFEHNPPRVWLSPDRLGIINFEDEAAEVTLPPGLPEVAEDFWTRASVPLGERVMLQAHESLLVKL